MPYVNDTSAVNAPYVSLRTLSEQLGSGVWRQPLVGTKNVRVVVMQTAAGTSLPAHLHPRADETFFVASGEAGFTFDSNPEIVAKPGSILFARHGVRRAVRVLGRDPLLWIAVVTPNEDAPNEQID
jgi:quercetin dioxygenase-like cupin family protein